MEGFKQFYTGIELIELIFLKTIPLTVAWRMDFGEHKEKKGDNWRLL